MNQVTKFYDAEDKPTTPDKAVWSVTLTFDDSNRVIQHEIHVARGK